MSLVLLDVILAILVFMTFTGRVGLARVKFGIDAPATSGNPEFERHFRVQQNTLEQLIVFIPAILIFAYSAESIAWPGHKIASVLGIIWVLARLYYGFSYVRDPKSRGAGFVIAFLCSAFMVLGSLVALFISLT